MYGNVSGVLQTRKTTKNHVSFLRIHYNRNPYTNGHLLLFFILGYSGAPSEPCMRNDRAPMEIKIVPNCEKKVVVLDTISPAVTFYNVFQITKQSNCHREMCKYFNEMSKYQHFMTCLLEPNHMTIVKRSNIGCDCLDLFWHWIVMVFGPVLR